VSPEEALRQGVSAYNGGYYEIAIPALEHAAAKDIFLAQYYLARLYSDNNSAYTDHAKAYMLYQKIANEYADADPDDETRAPYVARALTELAGYVRLGLPEIGLKANATLAAEYLNHAALFFNDEDAQFELAKLQLHGAGVAPDVARAKHLLAIIAQKGHAGAQAFLADLYWRGKFMQQDPVRALALISVAVKNAPAQDRVWIEDIYQNIYCGASKGVRNQVTGMVAEWDTRYGRKPAPREQGSLGLLDQSPERTCANGEVVPLRFDQQPAAAPAQVEASRHPTLSEPATANPPRAVGNSQPFMTGTTTPRAGEFRNVGAGAGENSPR
jgi:TPR repeat protein